jgi:hypothetical protein
MRVRQNNRQTGDGAIIRAGVCCATDFVADGRNSGQDCGGKEPTTKHKKGKIRESFCGQWPEE